MVPSFLAMSLDSAITYPTRALMIYKAGRLVLQCLSKHQSLVKMSSRNYVSGSESRGNVSRNDAARDHPTQSHNTGIAATDSPSSPQS